MNPEISYELQPNNRAKAFRSMVTTNSLGFRSPEPDRSTPMIVTLGDSITFGYGVEDDETLAARLQELLPEYSLQNAGVPGYHIRQEVETYNEKIEPLKPTLLILVFYWNDFDLSTSWLDDDNVLRSEGWKKEERTCKPIENGVLKFVPGKCWLDLHSAFYRVVKNVVNTRSGFEKQEVIRETEIASQMDPVTDEDRRRYAQELQKLRADIPKLFVIWPEAELHEQARPMLKTIAEQNGFAVLDLYDHFGNDMETLSWDYVHPSADTLKEAAQVIHDAIAEHQLLL